MTRAGHPSGWIAVSVGGETPFSDPSTKVERVSAPLREQVLDLIRREIVEMRLLPGQRLVERELVEQIGVSRTTVREALRTLTAEGLVTAIPQKGAIVAVPSLKEAEELYEVRALLEGLVARHFVERASETEVRALRRAFKDTERHQKDADPRPMILAANRFYDVLLEGAGDATVSSIIEGLRARVAALRATTLSIPGRRRKSVAELRAIVEAIEARDAAAASAACSAHVLKAADCLRELREGSTADAREAEDAPVGNS